MTPLLILTDFPGKTDLVTKTLLSGATGKLFWEIWEDAGGEEKPPVISVLPVRPMDSKIDSFCVSKKEALELDASYSEPMVKAGKYLHPKFFPWLKASREKIRELKPNLVLALGSFATWALLGTSKLTQIRGTATTTFDGIKVLPTYHPMTMVRAYEQRYIATMDIMKALYEAKTSELVRPQRKVHILENRNDILWARSFLSKQSLLSLDIETKLQQITCLSFAPNEKTSIVFPFVAESKSGKSYWDDPADEVFAWQVVKELCENDKIDKLLQNGVYDLQYLWRVMGIKVRGFRHDTMLLHHALYMELPKSLGFLGSIYTNEASWKLMRKWNEKEVK